MTLLLSIGGFVFIAVGIIVLLTTFNWEAALVLVAVGVGIIFFLRRSQ